ILFAVMLTGPVYWPRRLWVLGWCLVSLVGGWVWLVVWLCGGYSGRVTPGSVPIPVAKPASADGTALQGVWETRSLPHDHASYHHPAPFFLLFCVCGVVRWLVG